MFLLYSRLLTGKLLDGAYGHLTPSLTRLRTFPGFYQPHVGAAAGQRAGVLVSNARLPADGGEERHVPSERLDLSTCRAALGEHSSALRSTDQAEPLRTGRVRACACTSTKWRRVVTARSLRPRRITAGERASCSIWPRGWTAVERASAASASDVCVLNHLSVCQPALTPPYFTYHQPTCT